MSVIFSHPTGNANVRAAANGLADAKLLTEFYTTLAVFPGGLLDRLGALSPLAELRRRQYSANLRQYSNVWPWLEAGRLIALRTGFHQLIKHEKGFFSIDAVYRNLDRRVSNSIQRAAQRGAKAVYAYEDGAADSFRRAKALGLQCFYDLPIGYWRAARRLLAPEKDRWPEWVSSLDGFLDSETKLARKDDELRLADRILVASSFTAATLRDFPGALAPIEVIPYGFPTVDDNKPSIGFQARRPLKLLFVGGLSQRKGIADLFAVAAALGPRVELTIVGQKATNNCPALDAALARHRWIPSLPHADVLRLMQAHDVLVFPSLFEGFGLVITEAMSQGTPVITTDRTAGPDLIEHGYNGWIIQAGSTPALQSAIEELLLHPESVSRVGQAARETARRRPWSMYGKELAAVLNKCL